MEAVAQIPDRLMKLPEVVRRVGLGKTMIYGKVKEGTFPKPYKVCGVATRWSEHEISAWIADVKGTTDLRS